MTIKLSVRDNMMKVTNTFPTAKLTDSILCLIDCFLDIIREGWSFKHSGGGSRTRSDGL